MNLWSGRQFWTLAREALKAVALLVFAAAAVLFLFERMNRSRSQAPELRAGEWRESENATRVELEHVVLAQLQAIQQRRFMEAYTYAAPSLQRQVALEDFERMIWGVYPELTVTSLQDFGEAVDNGVSEASIEVKLVPPFGERYWFVYFLVRDGRDWRILGVARQPPPWGRGRRRR